MGKRSIFIALVCSLLLFLTVLTAAQELSARDILNNVDALISAPQDQTLQIRMVLINKDGKEVESRELTMMQKGSDLRMGKFLSPASQRGIGFLSLPNDIFYVYLPAFKKTQRIATRQKGGKFAGTDFSYQDLGAQNYSEGWDSQLLSSAGDCYNLQLTATEDNDTGYKKLILWVDKETFYPLNVEFYDQKGNLTKTMTGSKLETISGYVIAREMAMTDVLKNTTTKMFIEKAEFDTGLTDDIFTERYLSR